MLDHYTFGVKESHPEVDQSASDRVTRLQEEFRTTGMRRVVEAVLVMHDHSHPHILTLQVGGGYNKLYVLPSFLPST
jgi:cleavage and polyadenylation specificity factor subunit 5